MDRVMAAIRADLRAEALIQNWPVEVFEYAATYTPEWWETHSGYGE